MSIFDSFLDHLGVVILDGGFATELEKEGADIKDDLWSAKVLMENPEMVERVHKLYFQAGADVAITSSYQGTYEGFEARGISPDRSIELFTASTALAKSAAAAFWSERDSSLGNSRVFPLAAASVGPYGAFLADGSEYKGNYGLSVEELAAWHAPRLETLVKSNPDLLACETIPCIDEARALLSILPRVAAGVPVMMCFTLADATHMCSGELFTDCVSVIESSGLTDIVGVGINCSNPAVVEEALRSVKPLTTKLLVVYPNSGEVWDHDSFSWQQGTGAVDAQFVNYADAWYEAGARVIGGCCRTTPATVAALREMFERKRQSMGGGGGDAVVTVEEDVEE